MKAKRPQLLLIGAIFLGAVVVILALRLFASAPPERERPSGAPLVRVELVAPQEFRFGFRLLKPPLITGALALLAGYMRAAIRRIDRAVTPELMRFHRREQMQKLRNIFKSVLTFKKVDGFAVGPKQAGAKKDKVC